MKSRLAVSVLFILIAATFTPDVAGAFERVKAWTATVWRYYAIQRRHLVSSRDSTRMSAVRGGGKHGITMIHDGDLLLSRICVTESQPGVVRTMAPAGKTFPSDSLDSTKRLRMHKRHRRGFLKFIGSTYHGENLEFIAAAAKQIHEVLDLMCTK
jgi:hypothetical protein